MSLKKWFYHGGPKSGWLLSPIWTQPRCRRKAGESLGGWDSEWHAAL
jgi:hypothetical protein